EKPTPEITNRPESTKGENGSVTKGGRRFSFTSLALIKDEEKKGVAYAHMGGKEPMKASSKAFRKAQKKLLNYFSTAPRTIPRDITVHYNATKLILKPTPPGSGIKASEMLATLCKYLEIKDEKNMSISNYLTTIVKKRKTVGRGDKTAGRGQKGQKSRKSGHVRPGFEGGQTEVARRFPKRGGGFRPDRISYQVINLAQLEADEKITNGQTVDFTQEKFPVKILGTGNFTKNLTIQATAFSRQAQEKITQAGGNFKIKAKKNLLGLAVYILGARKISFP
ncbi:14858_t:CDS:2, partial [Cetraspora pellucida]